jgi:hypothetical protein
MANAYTDLIDGLFGAYSNQFQENYIGLNDFWAQE